LEDGALRVESTFKLSFKLNGVGIGFSKILIEAANIVIASSLEFAVVGIRFLLVSN